VYYRDYHISDDVGDKLDQILDKLSSGGGDSQKIDQLYRILVGGETPEHLTITLAGSCSGSANAISNLGSSGSFSGAGTYTITGTYVTRVQCTAGSTSISYTNINGQAASATLNAGSEVIIKNNETIRMANSQSGSLRSYGTDSSYGSGSWSSTLNIFF